MITIGKDVLQVSKLLDDNKTFANFYKEYNYHVKLLNSANTILNKDLSLLTNMKRVVTDRNRIAYIDDSIKQLNLVNNMVKEIKYAYDTTKLYMNYKISEKTFEQRIINSENRYALISNQIDQIGKKLDSLEKNILMSQKVLKNMFNLSILFFVGVS